jgi:hypothetical protein
MEVLQAEKLVSHSKCQCLEVYRRDPVARRNKYGDLAHQVRRSLKFEISKYGNEYGGARTLETWRRLTPAATANYTPGLKSEMGPI